MNMSKTAWTFIGLFTLTIGLVVAFGWSAPGSPATPEPSAIPEATNSPATAEEEASLANREETVALREEELDARMREVDARIAELERREVRSVAPVPAPETGPPFPRRFDRSELETKPAPQVVQLTIPAATPIEVELRDTLSSEVNLAGDPVRATLIRDVLQDGLVVIPAGSDLFGTVIDAVPQKKFGGQARLALEFDRIELASGESVAVRTGLDLAGKKQKKKDAATIGGATAGGAVLGRVLGGDDKTKSTVIGAVLGGAIGTAVAAENRGDPVVLDSGTTLELELEVPTHLSVTVPQTT